MPRSGRPEGADPAGLVKISLENPGFSAPGDKYLRVAIEWHLVAEEKQLLLRECVAGYMSWLLLWDK